MEVATSCWTEEKFLAKRYTVSTPFLPNGSRYMEGEVGVQQLERR